jgi:hypothetical protein
MKKFKSMGGLTVKNGRLINDRPVGISGIQEAVEMKSSMKKIQKVNMIADGIELSEGRKGFFR